MTTTTATVETLTAEVRVLQVGNRQVTLSVYRQLDIIDPDEIEPFGRVRDSKDEDAAVYVIGRDRNSGALARAHTGQRFGARTAPPKGWCRSATNNYGGTGVSHAVVAVASDDARDKITWKTGYTGGYLEAKTFKIDPNLIDECNAIIRSDFAANARERARHAEWSALPLIVLAGLR